MTGETVVGKAKEEGGKQRCGSAGVMRGVPREEERVRERKNMDARSRYDG